MKFFVNSKTSVMLFGFCAAILIGAGSAEADFIFGTPTNLGPVVNSSADEHPAGMTADGLSLYFSSRRAGGYSEWYDIWVSTRPTKDDPWGEPVNLGPAINTVNSDFEPDISPDGLILVFVHLGTAHPDWDIWMSTRPTTDDPWGRALNLGPTINSYVEDMDPCISADGLTLYFNSRRSGGNGETDIYMTTRPTRNDSWAEPVNLSPPVNTSSSDYGPEISADGRTLFFNSNRPGGLGGADFYMTRRPTINDPWGTPVNLGAGVNSSGSEDYSAISSDERLLLFSSSRSGGQGGTDIWQAPIIPVVDFNGDGIVDSADMCIMVDHWGESYSLCDIGPTPLGDGIINIQDMIVLAEHMFDKALPVDLIAHWKLDETEGNVAQDSAGKNDAFVLGGAVWLPDIGQVNGALLIDGIDDCVMTGPIPNLTDGPFRVFAWVIGGIPGQVVLSQSGSVNWLCTDSSEGYLMTELKSSGPDGCPLISEAVITDSDWHRIGLVWDGSHRTLYVDDIVVAEDTQDNLTSSTNSLYFGTSSTMQSGTYWNGLIDDVRIYKRVARP